MILSERQIKDRIIKYLMYKTVIKDLKKCLICNTLRIDEEMRNLHWESNFILNHSNHTIVFTICPNCRKLPIENIYTYIIKRRIKGE